MEVGQLSLVSDFKHLGVPDVLGSDFVAELLVNHDLVLRIERDLDDCLVGT